jgi:hypothetical protein
VAAVTARYVGLGDGYYVCEEVCRGRSKSERLDWCQRDLVHSLRLGFMVARFISQIGRFIEVLTNLSFLFQTNIKIKLWTSFRPGLSNIAIFAIPVGSHFLGSIRFLNPCPLPLC